MGVTEIKKAAALDLDGPVAKSAANYFQTIRLMDDALAIWRNIERQNPNDADAPAHIGDILVQERKYSDALPELQNATKLNPSNARVLLELGQSYFATGDKDQGLANVQKAVALDSSPLMLNNAAYDLADGNMDLADASKFAKEAVTNAELVTNSVSLNKPSVNDLNAGATVANYWDTLGWVYFQRGDFDDAADYLNAAWHVTLQPIAAYHLGQVYERQGKTHDAVVAYNRAVVAGYGPDAQNRLDVLRPDGRLQPGEQFTQTDLQNMRAFALPRIYSGSANAYFYVLLGPADKVIDAKFTSGDEVLHEKGEEALKNVKFNIPFPKGSSAQILRRGVINCEIVVSRCTLVLVPPPTVAQ
jgi:tetratricopeptide (TPR) repeat protein